MKSLEELYEELEAIISRYSNRARVLVFNKPKPLAEMRQIGTDDEIRNYLENAIANYESKLGRIQL